MSMYHKVKAVLRGRGVTSEDFEVLTDFEGERIARWGEGLGPVPTAADLDASDWQREQARAGIYADISALEGTITPRRAREALLSEEGRAWLVAIDGQIAALRAAL